MAKLERDVENRFFDIISKQQENPSSNAYGIYQKLVFYRYEEIINNTFPLFIKYVSPKELDESIFLFLKNPPSTPFVWQIADDYRKMVKKKKLFHNRKFLYELLYFDWIELELLMKEYKTKKIKEFSWENSYTLKQSARIKRFKYDIINTNYEEKRENFTVIYYDFSSDEVLFREINEFLYALIKNLNKKESIKKTLKKLCKQNDINLNEAMEVLEEPLKELIGFRVI
ncbi:HvfC family peptide modification chaperone [Malaciobacter sp. WC5094]